jgi:hypothetical protein
VKSTGGRASRPASPKLLPFEEHRQSAQDWRKEADKVLSVAGGETGQRIRPDVTILPALSAIDYFSGFVN